MEWNLTALSPRRPKTRSFDNLPSACEVFPNRRSSDPSLNEKWQDHRRSLEVNRGAGPEPDQDEKPAGQPGALMGPNGVRTGPVDGAEPENVENGAEPGHVENVKVNGTRTGEAMGEELNGEELEPAVSVGQMENALQGATEDAAAVKGRQGNVNARAGRTGARGAICMNRTAPDGFANGVDTPGATIAETLTHTDAGLKLNGVHTHTVNGSLAAPTPEPQGVLESQEPGELGVPSASSPLTPAPCQQMPAALRTMSNGSERAEEPEQPVGPEPQPPERLDPEQPVGPEPEPELEPQLPEQLDKRLSLMESSTETLTEEGSTIAPRLDPLASPPPSSRGQPGDEQSPGPTRPDSTESEATPEPASAPRLPSTSQRPSLSALAPAPTPDASPPCNGESWEPESGTPLWARSNGERAPLSRQLSAASCGSLTLQYAPAYPPMPPPLPSSTHPYLLHRGSCSQHRCLHGLMARAAAASPEQVTSRSHLDEDGLAMHTDVVQQRLRQIDALHQAEVEALKRQVQELWSRLESQQATGAGRLNGDVGDEVVRELTPHLTLKHWSSNTTFNTLSLVK